jgi:hypothetical protein
MPIFGMIELAAQIYCIVHCIRQRKNSWWVLFILFVPVIGCAVYFITEVLPEIQGRRRYGGGTANANPLRYRPAPSKVSQLRESVDFSNTVKNRENLADELARQGEYTEAVSVYQSCLKGFSENDVGILYKLAEAAFAAEDYATSLDAVHKVRALSDYRASKVRLLLARNYAAQGDTEKATQVFEQAIEKHGDIEIRYRYAEFLYERNHHAQALQILAEIQQAVDRLPSHARKLNSEWIKRAQKAQKTLQKEMAS